MQHHISTRHRRYYPWGATIIIILKSISKLMKYQIGTYSMRLILVAVMATSALLLQAQLLRTSYFMEGSQYRLMLNPALAPDRGYVHLPGIGQTNGMMYSNSMGHNDVVEMIKNKAQADFFTDENFINNLKDVNHASVNVGTDLLNVGWWQGQAFWTLGFGVKGDGYAVVPREWFDFMSDMKQRRGIDYSDYTRHIGNEKFGINVYSELSLGYSRPLLGDKLFVGGRLKGLFGMANMNLTVNEAVIKTRIEGLDPDFDWNNPDVEQLINSQGSASFDVDAELECSTDAVELLQGPDGYIDDVEFKPTHIGFAGAGAGVDVGISYKVTPSLTLSAAINDVGFISWSKGFTKYASSNTADMNFDTDDPSGMMYFADVTGEGKTLNLDLLRLELDEQKDKSRTTWLAPILVVGGEYKLMNDKLGFGLLYTNRFAAPRNENELTMSVNYRPSRFVDLAMSYSPVMCNGKAFGFAVKLGPLFVGSDYVFLGKNNKCSNVLVGLSIPLGWRLAPEDD